MNESTESIEGRLKETSASCLEFYQAWNKNKKDSKAYEDLGSAVHELRKVASRLEIEMAISERDSGVQKPIAPPMHKTLKGGAVSGKSGDQPDRPRQRRTSRKPKAAGGNAAD